MPKKQAPPPEPQPLKDSVDDDIDADHDVVADGDLAAMELEMDSAIAAKKEKRVKAKAAPKRKTKPKATTKPKAKAKVAALTLKRPAAAVAYSKAALDFEKVANMTGAWKMLRECRHDKDMYVSKFTSRAYRAGEREGKRLKCSKAITIEFSNICSRKARKLWDDLA